MRKTRLFSRLPTAHAIQQNRFLKPVAGRDNSLCPCGTNGLYQRIGIIALICNNRLGRQIVNQFACTDNIGNLTFCNDQP